MKAELPPFCDRKDAGNPPSVIDKLGLWLFVFAFPFLGGLKPSRSAFALTLMAILIAGKLLERRPLKLALPAAFWPFLALNVLAILSLVVAPDRFHALVSLPQLWLLVASFCFFPLVLRSFAPSTILRALLLPVTLSLLLGFVQYATFPGRGYLLFSFFFNPNIFAGFLVMVLPLFYARMMTEARAGWRWRFGAAAAAATLALVMTGSRAALIALAASLGLSAFRRGAVARRLLLIGGAGVIVALTANPTLGSKFARLVQDDVSLRFRLLVWRGALEILEQFPAGSGFYGFERLYPTFKLGGSTTLMAHNTFLQMAADFGWAGFFLFTWFAMAVLIQRRRDARRAGAGLDEQARFCAALAFFLHNTVDYTFYFPAHLLLLALVCSPAAPPLLKGPAEAGIANRLSAAGRRVSALAFCLLGFSSLFFCYHLTLYETSEDLYREEAYEEAAAVLEQSPLLLFSASALHLCGKIYLKLGKTGRATSCLRRAVARYPREPVAVYHLGVAYLHAGDEAEAERWLRRSIELQPSETDPRRELGHLHLRQGRRRQARAQFEAIERVFASPYGSKRYAPIPDIYDEENLRAARAALALLDRLESEAEGKTKE